MGSGFIDMLLHRRANKRHNLPVADVLVVERLGLVGGVASARARAAADTEDITRCPCELVRAVSVVIRILE